MADEAAPHRLWGGRFGAAPDDLTERLNNSLAFDCRLWREDIEASIAHAEMLGETGVLPVAEAAAIVQGLKDVRARLEQGELSFDPRSEDVHTAVEALLRDQIGALAGKLHTARSRNDQVATDLRLYLMRSAVSVVAAIRRLQGALVDVAEAELETVLPGYTHLQHAQPVVLAQHVLAYFWMLQRDVSRFSDWRQRCDELPLGAGALAGTTFPINPELVARKLGFARIAANSMDAVSDRDFVLEFLANAAILMVHCSRLGEELVLWSSPEFGFISLADTVTTGSSIMPQKKNPDVPELARGKSGRVIGHLVALLTVMKGLPLTYNKDMQEDKEAVFDTVDTLLGVLPALELCVRTCTFHRDRMREAVRGDFSTATDLADALVRAGRPFREAHELVGKLVRECLGRGVSLEELRPEDMVAMVPELACVEGIDLSVDASVSARMTPSGVAPQAVRNQLARARQLLAA